MAWLLIQFVRLYRRVVSPLKPACCRFKPTCSEYAIEALREHGTIKGTYLSVWRILRCNPFGRWGFDPVPLKGTWHHPDSDLHPNRAPEEPETCAQGQCGGDVAK